jgi:Gas vesicle synthesis protein GvpL/GvpF
MPERKKPSRPAKQPVKPARKTAATAEKAKPKAARPAAVPASGRAVRSVPSPAEPLMPFSHRGDEMDDAPYSAVAAANGRSGKYVYCIIEANESLHFGPIGMGSEPADVHTVNYRNIAAVVSDTPLEVYDPTRENVLAHERVNEVVMRDYTVIPMSFSTVFKTSEDIIELLRTAYDAFHDVLVKMRGKVEFGLKVLWEPDIVIREIEKENENLRLLRQEISSQKGSTYFARMQYGRLVDSLLQERSEQLAADIFNALGDVSVASRANKVIGDKMILNAAFLVPRERELDFDTKVKEIDARYENLKFKYTGPWPPYNFVNIRLKLERAKDSE